MTYTKPKVKLLSHTMNPELVVACAGKLCYSKVGVDALEEKQTDESVQKFLNMLVDIGHESPLEHISFTFAIEGISRACSHQIVRHRIASYSQQSQRYVNLVEDFEYIMPPAYRENDLLKSIFIEAMEQDEEAYRKLVHTSLMLRAKELGLGKRYAIALRDEDEEFKKECPDLVTYFKLNMKKEYAKAEKEAIEDARYVFPNACETKMVVTMNARSLINFFDHRCCERAQWEIRDLAEIMLMLVKTVAYNIFKKSGPNCVSGPCPEGAMSCGKVQEKREKFLCFHDK